MLSVFIISIMLLLMSIFLFLSFRMLKQMTHPALMAQVFIWKLLFSCLLSVFLGILFVILTFAISFIVRPSSAPPSMGQHPKSYMEVITLMNFECHTMVI